MNAVDIGVLVIMSLSALMGVMRGLTREVLGLLSWLAAGFSAFFTLPLGRNLAYNFIQNQLLADAVASLVLFLLFLILFSFISQFFAGLVRQSVLGGIDRSLGFGYGLLRGFAIICLVEMVISIFVIRPEQPSLIRESHLSAAIYRGSDLIFNLLPLSLQKLLKQQQQKYTPEQPSAEASLEPKEKSQKAEELLTSMLTHQLQQGAQAIIPPSVSRQSPPPSTQLQSKELSSSESSQNKANDNQKTVEELARLKPKVASSHDKGGISYSKKQRLDMERLLTQTDTQENDEAG